MQPRRLNHAVNSVIFCLGFLAVAAFPYAATAQTATVATVYSFTNGADGAGPAAGLIDAGDGTLWGTTAQPNELTDGTVFSVTTGGVFNTVYTWPQPAEPVSPNGVIFGANGALYGTSVLGGADGLGSIFQVTSGGALSTLFSFGDANSQTGYVTDGDKPGASLLLGSDGNYYGTTTSGGAVPGQTGAAGAGQGTVFRITPDGDLTVLHVFSGADGASPEAALIEGSDGSYYGSTKEGGSLYGTADGNGEGAGTIFKITSTGVFTSLCSFTGTDGYGPVSAVVEGTDGNFYGTTPSGGAAFDFTTGQMGYGTVFKVDPTGRLTTLYSFSGTDGAGPASPLIGLSNDIFFGSTEFGGMSFMQSSPGTGDGTLFEISTTGQLTTLHQFSGTDGSGPSGSIVLAANGDFYGTTTIGGASSVGVIYQAGVAGGATALPPAAPVITASQTGTQVTLSWPIVSGASGYNVYESTATGGEGSVPFQAGQAGGATITELSPGVTYYFEVTAVGSGGESAKSNEVAATISSSSVLTLDAGLNFFSSPYNAPDLSIDDVLGYAGAKLALWSQADDAYSILTAANDGQILTGVGYWARFPQTVPLTSASGTAASTSSSFDIPLSAGWTAIGAPFTTPTALAGLTFDNGTESISTAITNQLIAWPLWRYDQTTGTYVAATSLDPGVGYWVYATSATDMQVPPPAQ